MSSIVKNNPCQTAETQTSPSGFRLISLDSGKPESAAGAWKPIFELPKNDSAYLYHSPYLYRSRELIWRAKRGSFPIGFARMTTTQVVQIPPFGITHQQFLMRQPKLLDQFDNTPMRRKKPHPPKFRLGRDTRDIKRPPTRFEYSNNPSPSRPALANRHPA